MLNKLISLIKLPQLSVKQIVILSVCLIIGAKLGFILNPIVNAIGDVVAFVIKSIVHLLF